MRKIRKLIKNPKAFFRDSILVKKAEVLKEKKKNKGVKINVSESLNDIKEKSKDVRLFDTNENIRVNKLTSKALLPREGIIDISFISNYIFKHVNCFTILNESRVVLCVASQDLMKLYGALAQLSVSQDLLIQYVVKGKLKQPSNYSELLDDLYHRKVVDLQLKDARKSLAVILFSIELWDKQDDIWTAPRANMYSRKLYLSNEIFNRDNVPDIKDFFNKPHSDEYEFDIDVVYTWVNSEDPDWKQIYSQYALHINNSDSSSLSRFTNREELKYSLRSIYEYAPWVRNIYIVSNCSPPVWLNLENDRIKWIYHEEIMDCDYLPTFNSHAIESSIHKIPGLSNYFIYFNDDCFFAKNIKKSDFFLSNGIAKLRFEPYGMVHGKPSMEDPDYLNAARNGQYLLEKTFYKTVTELHTHSPQAMNMSLLQELEKKYKTYFDNTRKNRFRDITDISVTSFLYQHYAYLIGKGIKDRSNVLLIKSNSDYKSIYKKLLNDKGRNTSVLSFCINDGKNSHLHDGWNKHAIEFLDSYFPNKSSFEI